MAYEVATRLKAPLDVFLVRKLGVPGHPELAMGAIAAGGIEVFSRDLIRDLGIPHALIEQVAVRERLELERRDDLYRGARRPAVVRDGTIILVDDGLATGSTMRGGDPGTAAAGARADRGGRARRRAGNLRPPASDRRRGRVCRDAGAVQCRRPLVRGVFADDRRRGEAATRGRRTIEDGGSQTASARADVLSIVRERARPLKAIRHSTTRLIEGIGDARVVLLGEATHGTHEFYRERAFITRRLITEKGFSAVAVEADWPDEKDAARTCSA